MPGRPLAVLMLLVVGAVKPVWAQFASHSSDFNGDGFDDLAIGIPGKDFPDATDAGAVRVVYGSVNGLVSAGSRLLRRGNGLPGREPLLSERIGTTLAVGDFNGDGRADLAIGAPLAPVPEGSSGGAGNLEIAYGTATGLGSSFDSFDPQARGALFAAAIAAGDFDSDGFDELAVAAPGAGPNHGAVVIYVGSASGLLEAAEPFMPPVILRKSSLGLQPLALERFGSSLVVGDFNHDDFADLAIGSPGTLGAPGPPHGGDVVVVYGRAGGLSATPEGVQFFHQDTPGVIGARERLDQFGFALSAADFDGNGSSDLAVGVPGESLEGTATISAAGAVNLLFGFTGLSANQNQQWHQDSEGVGGAAEAGDRFGSSVGAGDFDADGSFELVIGVPSENFVGFGDAGVFHVLYGPPRPPGSFTRQELWHQDENGLAYGVEAGDRSGQAFGTGDFDGDGYQDLAIGAPGEQIAGTPRGGAVVVLYGGSQGLDSARSQVWAEHSIGFGGTVAENDMFGSSLSNATHMSRRESPIRSPITGAGDREVVVPAVNPN